MRNEPAPKCFDHMLPRSCQVVIIISQRDRTRDKTSLLFCADSACNNIRKAARRMPLISITESDEYISEYFNIIPSTLGMVYPQGTGTHRAQVRQIENSGLCPAVFYDHTLLLMDYRTESRLNSTTSTFSPNFCTAPLTISPTVVSGFLTKGCSSRICSLK